MNILQPRLSYIPYLLTGKFKEQFFNLLTEQGNSRNSLINIVFVNMDIEDTTLYWLSGNFQ